MNRLLTGEGINGLPASAAAWLAAFAGATVAGGICLGFPAYVGLSRRLAYFEPSFGEVVGDALTLLARYLLVGSGVLLALVLLVVTSAILTSIRLRRRGIETSLFGRDGLLSIAVVPVVGCALVLVASEVARWLALRVPPYTRVPLVTEPGERLVVMSDGLFIGAGVVAALALAQVLSAVVRRIRTRSPAGDPPPTPQEDAGLIAGPILPGPLSSQALGFIVVAAAGSVCLWLGLLDRWLSVAGQPVMGGFVTRGDISPHLRPDVSLVVGQALTDMGSGLFAGAGVLVALAWLGQAARASDRRPAGLLSGARLLVMGFVLTVLAAAIVFWLTLSVYLGRVLAQEPGWIVLFGLIFVWESSVGERMASVIALYLAQGLIVGAVVAGIPAFLQVAAASEAEVEGSGQLPRRESTTLREAAPGFIAVLLAGGLCVLVGREFALENPPRTFNEMLIVTQVALSTGLFIGAGVLAAAIVSLALGALQRRVSERPSQDSPA